MSKKAFEMSINAIVIAALALLVLIILALVFSSQVREGVKKYLGISSSAEEDIKSKDKCETFFSGRQCFASKPEQGYILLPGTWKDCQEKGFQCYERVNV